MPRCAIYARVSSAGQIDNTSLDSQIHDCRTEAQTKGYSVVAELREEGVSGSKYDRPSMSQLLLLASTGRIDTVLLAKVDRLARGRLVDAMLEAELLKSGVRVHYVGRDTSTKEGRLLVNIEKDFAEWEREAIAERTQGGKNRTVRDGKIIPTRHTAIGYTYDPATRALVVDEARADTVRLIFTLFADEGLSLFKVAKRLNALRVPTRSGSAHWIAPHIRDVITSELYVGRWVWNKYRHIRGDKAQGTKHRRVLRSQEEWLVVSVPAIVQPEQWQRAQARLHTNAYYSDRRKKWAYMLSGILFCGYCKRRMVGRNCKPRHYYACPKVSEANTRTEGPASCTARLIRVESADAVVWDEVCRQIANADEIMANLRRKQAHKREARADLDTAFLEASLLKLKERHALLVDLYLDGRMDSKEEFTEKRAEIERDMQEAQREIDRRATIQAALTSPLEHATGFLARTAGLTLAGIQDLPMDRRIAFLREWKIIVVADSNGKSLSVYGLLEEALDLPLPAVRRSRSA